MRLHTSRVAPRQPPAVDREPILLGGEQTDPTFLHTRRAVFFQKTATGNCNALYMGKYGKNSFCICRHEDSPPLLIATGQVAFHRYTLLGTHVVIQVWDRVPG